MYGIRMTEKQRLALSLLPAVVAWVLELLPYGAVLNFARAPEEGGGTIRRTFSYFSLTPFGYANFFPLLTAIFTVAVLMMTAVLLLRNQPVGHRWRKGLFASSCAAFVCSLMPLVQFDFAYVSAVGAAIAGLWLVSLVLQIILAKRGGEAF